jgi:hypothetical protein
MKTRHLIVDALGAGATGILAFIAGFGAIFLIALVTGNITKNDDHFRDPARLIFVGAVCGFMVGILLKGCGRAWHALRAARSI